MISLRKIAKIANVSVATVSYVLKNKVNNIPLSQETVDKVWEVVRNTKYCPNNDIGIFVPLHGLSPFYQQFFTGIYEESVKNNLRSPVV